MKTNPPDPADYETWDEFMAATMAAVERDVQDATWELVMTGEVTIGETTIRLGDDTDAV